MRKISFVFIALFVFSFSRTGSAQEVQLPIYEEGGVMNIDADLDEELGLFAEYRNFLEARLFQVSDTSFVLEISYQPGDRLLKKRLPLSLAELENFRTRVSERIRQRVPRTLLDQEGRTRLLIGTTTLSMGYYGWALPTMLNARNEKSYTALYLLTSSAGFYFPFILTRESAVTEAAARLSIYGGVRGIGHGMLVTLLFDSAPEDNSLLLAGMLASLAEAGAGFHVANTSNMSTGTARVIGVGGDFGTGMAALAAVLGDLYEDREAALAGVILLGSGFGLAGGNYLANLQNYSEGDAIFLGSSALIGAYLPFSVVLISETEKDKSYALAAILGGVAGLTMGHSMLRGKDFSVKQANLIALSGLAGGSLTLGITYLILSSDSYNLLPLSAGIGMAVGTGLMYRSQAVRARERNTGSSLEVNFRPEGLFAFTMSRRMAKNASLLPPPLFTIRYGF